MPGAALSAEENPRYAGPSREGFLLPNGWTISPAGEQVPLTDLPLNILPLAGGRQALVGSSGYNRHELVLVDLDRKEKLLRRRCGKAGLAWRWATSRTACGGRAEAATRSTCSNCATTSSHASVPAEVDVELAGKVAAPTEHHFVSGVALDAAPACCTCWISTPGRSRPAIWPARPRRGAARSASGPTT